MMKHFPLWLKLSFLHPAVSVLLLSVALLCPTSEPWDAVAYAAGMLGVILNLPGAMAFDAICGWLSGVRLLTPEAVMISEVILITWGCVVVPICFGVSRLVRWLRRRRGVRCG